VDFDGAADGDAVSFRVACDSVEVAQVDGKPVERVVVGNAMAASSSEEWDVVCDTYAHNALDVKCCCRLDSPDAVGWSVVVAPSLP
jgi:hypothetical protein